jgi:hypothetical protein
MQQMNYKKAFEALSKEGFIGPEIDRLWRLRRDHVETEMDRAPVDLHRLEFVRWLVANGRLTDQVA